MVYWESKPCCFTHFPPFLLDSWLFTFLNLILLFGATLFCRPCFCKPLSKRVWILINGQNSLDPFYCLPREPRERIKGFFFLLTSDKRYGYRRKKITLFKLIQVSFTKIFLQQWCEVQWNIASGGSGNQFGKWHSLVWNSVEIWEIGRLTVMVFTHSAGLRCLKALKIYFRSTHFPSPLKLRRSNIS